MTVVAVAAASVFIGGVGYTVSTSTTPGGSTATVAAPEVTTAGPLVVIGDSFSAVDWTLDGTAAGWPAIVAERTDLELVNLALGGAGYVRASATTFPLEAAQVPEGASVVVVFGGYNDQWAARQHTPDVEFAAAATFAAVRRLAPGAALVVVGPQWPHDDTLPPDAPYLDARDRVRAQALAVGATWVDPIAERWFADRQELIGPDQVHPTAAGQAFIAEQIGARIDGALAP